MQMTKKIGMVSAVAAVLVGVSATPSMAGVDSDLSTAQGTQGRFLHDGDRLRIRDTARDGESVYGQYKINGGTVRTTAQWNGGVDTYTDFSTGNPAEGSTVTIRAAHQDEFAPDDFGEWKSGRA